MGTATSPTHLVREGPGQAVRWFAAGVRPQWGRSSKVATRANHLPLIGHRFLDGRAIAFRSPGCLPVWPGAPVDPSAQGAPGAGSPAVLHLGGGPTAGRLVLTWADQSGTPTHHTKVAPAHLAAGLRTEAAALRVLGPQPALSGTVPVLLGTSDALTWCALSAGHIEGRPPAEDAAGSVEAGDPAKPVAPADPTDVDSLVTAWLADLARAPDTDTTAVRQVAADELEAAAAAIGDGELRATVRRGFDLSANAAGLLHGDLWPGNVHVTTGRDGRSQLAVLDWESAMVGHPLADLLTWLVNRAGPGSQIRAGAMAALGAHSALGSVGAPGSGAAGHIERLLTATGRPLEAADVEALVLSQMVVIAVAGGPAGGDGAHERAWLDAVRDVWASWQGSGESPWSPCREVAR